MISIYLPTYLSDWRVSHPEGINKVLINTSIFPGKYKASLVVQSIKNLPAVWETQVQFLDREDPLEKGMAIHSNILAQRIPWREEPWNHKKLDMTERLTQIYLSGSWQATNGALNLGVGRG